MAASSSSNTIELPTVSIDELDDNVKRWIVVGICLHTVVSPQLRIYVNNELKNQYSNLVNTHKIDTQMYIKSKSLLQLPISNVYLNYQTINGNAANFKNMQEKYDYKVKNAVDLSKLFIQPYLTDYTAFDSKCDITALLGLVTNINTFNPDVRRNAEMLREHVRNKNAHPDFDQWDSAKYTDSFTLMKQIVNTMALDPTVTATVIRDLKNWEAKGIKDMSGTKCGITICKWFIQNMTKEYETNNRLMEDCIKNLQKNVDALTEHFKTDTKDTDIPNIVIEKREYDHKDFPRVDALQTILKKSLDKPEKDLCIPRKIYDVLEKRPQAIFCYQKEETPVDYKNYSVTRLGTSVKNTEGTWDEPQITSVTVCILRGTLDGKLTKTDTHVLKVLRDLPRKYTDNALFVVTGFFFDGEHKNRNVLHHLSKEISLALRLPTVVNTVYGRLFPHDHQDIGPRMSIYFEKQIIDDIRYFTDNTLRDIETSENFLTSEEFYKCRNVLNGPVEPSSRSNCMHILEKAIKRHKEYLNTYVVAEFETELRSNLQEWLIPNLPTHEWADLSRRTHSSTQSLKDHGGNFHFSDYFNFLKTEFELQQDDVITQEINDCKETHLKGIRKSKDYLKKTLIEILENRNQANKNEERLSELTLIVDRFDTSAIMSVLEDRWIIELTDQKKKLKDIQDFLGLFITNWRNIEYKERIEFKLVELMGVLRSGDCIHNLQQQCGTAGFFLRDFTGFYVVTCRHILLEGPCFIKYNDGLMSKFAQVERVFDVGDYDIAVCRIQDTSLVCIPGIRKDSEFDPGTCGISLESEIFVSDMMLLPIGLQVYKWGAGSGLTRGTYLGASFQGLGKYTLVHLKKDKEKPFALPGDSGSLICFKTELSTVYAAFVLIGTVNDYPDMLERRSDINTYCCVRIQDVLSFIASKSLDLKPFYPINL